MSETEAQAELSGHTGRLALERLVVSLASAHPTPAGGAAASAAVAQGIALLLKVIRISQKKNDLVALQACEAELTSLMPRALEAFEGDCEAFQRVLRALRGADESSVQEAWIGATMFPLELVSLACDVLETLRPVKEQTQENLALDQEAGVTFLLTGISISLANAEANLSSIPSAVERKRASRRLEQIRSSTRATLAAFGRRLPDAESPQREQS